MSAPEEYGGADNCYDSEQTYLSKLIRENFHKKACRKGQAFSAANLARLLTA